EHPAKIDALVNLGGERSDLPVVAKILPGGQYSCEQQRRINRGDFALPAPFARLRIQPMIKPATLMEGPVRKKSQRVARARARGTAVDPTAFDREAKRRQTETSRGDAGDVAMILIQRRTVHSSTVRNES